MQLPFFEHLFLQHFLHPAALSQQDESQHGGVIVEA